MKAFLERNLVAVLAVMGAFVVIAVVLNAIAVGQLSSARADIDDLTSDLEAARTEVESLQGALVLFTAQAGELQSALGELGPTVGGAIDEAIDGLATFRTSTIEFDVPINQTIPISTSLALDRTIDVPIKTTLPVDETFDTEITIEGPFGIDIPLNVTVPIQLDFPIDLVVPIPINETVPIDTSIPVNLTVPISVPVEGTELATLATSLEQGLASLRDVLTGLSGG